VNKQKGTVLGVQFDSTKMEWTISESKSDKIVERCVNVQKSSHISLKQTQELMGSINDLGQMCGFLKFYKWSGNNLLSKFKNDENLLLMVPEQLKEDLKVAAKVAITAKSGIPIASRKTLGPLSTLDFHTDAAGAKYNRYNGQYVMINEENRGICCIGGKNEDDTWIWSRMSWPENFLNSTDEWGIEIGRKSTTLESFGLLIPFVAFPEKIAGRHLRFWIDNTAVMFGWENGGVKHDKMATEILKCANILAAYLGCIIEVRHEKRVSSVLADLADELSRKKSSENKKWGKLMEETEFRKVEGSLQKVRTENLYELKNTLLKELKEKFEPM